MSPSLCFSGTRLEPEEFQSRYERSAAALRALGVQEGDVVALMLYNEPLTLELVLAVRLAGAHFCMINWHFKSAEVRHILSDSGAKLLVIDADLLEQVPGAIPDALQTFNGREWCNYRDSTPHPPISVQRPGTMMPYTSGTTGRPKGIKRQLATPRQVSLLAEFSRTVFGIEPGMRCLVSAPLYHSAPCSYTIQAALQGAQLWLEPHFDAEETLRLIEREQITHVYLVPTMCRRLLRLPHEVRSRYSLRSLKFVASTGEPYPAEVKAQMIDWFGPVIHEGYAASELGYITHIDSAEALQKPGSVGRALPGVGLKILGESGAELPAGSVGLIYARQLDMPDFTYANNDAARQRLERDGLWTLGDMGRVDEQGYLYVVDRQADMVISGGVNIYPAEIEAVLAAMPQVADAAVFGIPDDEFGEALMAAVQPIVGATLSAEDVQEFLRERLAGYKVPRRVEFLADLPREDTGKIFKRKLREPYWAGAGRKV